MKIGTVLIVDDEPDFVDNLAELLEGKGYSCLKAYNGEDAVHIFEQEKEHIDVVLLDWLMPGMDGDETLVKLKEIDPYVMVIMVSALGNEQRMTHSINLGARGYIHKPINDYGTALISRIRDLIELRTLMNRDNQARMGQLAGRIAHYMKNAFWNISGRAQMLLEKEEMDREEVQTSLRTIKRIAEDSNRILFSLMYFSQDKPQMLTLKQERLAPAILEVLDLLQPTIREKGVSIRFRRNDGEDYRLLIDRQQLGIAFFNILQNAVEAVDRGGTVNVDWEYDPATQRILIDIKDNGDGMDEGTLQRIFDPFYTTKKDGVGLGLSVANDIIRKHDGHIEAKSKIGQGTTFTIVLKNAEKIEKEKDTLAESLA